MALNLPALWPDNENGSCIARGNFEYTKLNGHPPSYYYYRGQQGSACSIEWSQMGGGGSASRQIDMIIVTLFYHATLIHVRVDAKIAPESSGLIIIKTNSIKYE